MLPWDHPVRQMSSVWENLAKLYINKNIHMSTHGLHMLHQHRHCENSQQCCYHRCSQLVWTEQLCKQHHQVLWWCLCLVQNVHCYKQLHLQKIIVFFMEEWSIVQFNSYIHCVTMDGWPHTWARIPKLSACHISINGCPSIITHSTPVSV